jgi:hypothetical protein
MASMFVLFKLWNLKVRTCILEWDDFRIKIHPWVKIICGDASGLQAHVTIDRRTHGNDGTIGMIFPYILTL